MSASTPASSSLFAAIDAGTSQVKCVALAGDADMAALRLVGSEPAEVSRPDPGSGAAEYDASAILAAAKRLLAQLARDAKAQGRRVRTIGLTGQVGGVLVVDRDGQPIAPSLTWEDQRGRREAEDFAKTFGRGNAGPLGTVLPPGVAWLGPRLRWLAAERPATIARAWKVLQLKDYLFLHLTGSAWSEAVSLIGLADVRGRRVHPDVLAWLGIGVDVHVDKARGLMPELREATATLPMKPDVAAALGFDPVDPPLVGIGTADMLAGFIGCGVGADEAVLLAGTAEVIGRTVPAASGDIAGATPTGVVRLPLRDGLDIVYGSTTHGGSSLLWLQRLLGPIDVNELAAEARKVAPGVSGLLFIPHLSGTRSPHWDATATGSLRGLRAEHGRPEIFRAVLEGCAYATRQVLDAAAPAHAGVISAVRLAGGTARIELWNEIRAAVLGLELRVLPVVEASALGALLLAGAAVAPELASRCAMASAGPGVRPNPEWVRLYDEGYRRFVRAARESLASAD
ncbi:MAG: FGGY-family carbohydrate kinase [Planctomycetota bacterium]|nr:FGGY-family carbohydrate kinase [Planctomycetota bacterium]